MAKDKNIVVLEGLVGDDFKYGKTSEGKEYAKANGLDPSKYHNTAKMY